MDGDNNEQNIQSEATQNARRRIVEVCYINAPTNEVEKTLAFYRLQQIFEEVSRLPIPQGQINTMLRKMSQWAVDPEDVTYSKQQINHVLFNTPSLTYISAFILAKYYLLMHEEYEADAAVSSLFIDILEVMVNDLVNHAESYAASGTPVIFIGLPMNEEDLCHLYNSPSCASVAPRIDYCLRALKRAEVFPETKMQK